MSKKKQENVESTLEKIQIIKRKTSKGKDRWAKKVESREIEKRKYRKE